MKRSKNKLAKVILLAGGGFVVGFNLPLTITGFVLCFVFIWIWCFLIGLIFDV